MKRRFRSGKARHKGLARSPGSYGGYGA
ncbi:MAG: hypothetical protein ACMUEL_04205 [Flavobacteriales bacterium Tduv]